MSRIPSAAKLVGVGLFLIAFSIYLFTASGRDFSSDGGQYYHTAEAFLDGRLWISKENALGARLSDNGNYYSKAAPLQSVVELPYLIAFRLLARVLGLDEESKNAASRAWVPTLTSATWVAATAVLAYLTVIQLGYGLIAACVVSVTLAYTTPLWIYARQDLSEPLQCFLLLGCFFTIIRARPPLSVGVPMTAGIALGLLVLVKAMYILLAPIFWLALLWQFRCNNVRDFFKISFASGIPVLIAGLIYLAWNYARWGSAFDFGFNEAFNTPLLIGLHGLFLSSGKSVFLYAPILVLLVVAMPLFKNRHPFATILIAAISVPIVGVHACFWAWHGDWAWGPRYLLPLTALWVLPIAALAAAAGMILRVLLLVFSLAGAFVQTLGVAISASNYLNVHVYQVTPVVYGGEPSMFRSQLDVHFIPEFSPLAGHYWLLRATIENMMSPGKPPAQNRRLWKFPWRHLVGPDGWRPANPEQWLGLDMWLGRPPKHMTKSAMIALASILSVIGLAGVIALAAGLRSAARSRP